MGVGSAGVVEAGDIGHQALLELLDGPVVAPVQFLFFQILEKALHDSVVIGVALGGKGLDHPQLVDHLAEVPGSKLTSSIRMEHDTFGNAPQPYSIPQVSIARNRSILLPTRQTMTFLVKSLGKKVLADASILFAYRRFWRLNGAHFGQPHLFHQPVHPTSADDNAILPRKTEGHLLRTQPFVGPGVKCQYPLPNLHILLLLAGGLMPQVLVVGAAPGRGWRRNADRTGRRWRSVSV